MSRHAYVLLACVCAATPIKYSNEEKSTFCRQLRCDAWPRRPTCGIREDSTGFRLRPFESECDLLMHGCAVEESDAYGLVNFEYCERAYKNNDNAPIERALRAVNTDGVGDVKLGNECSRIQAGCESGDTRMVCGIARCGAGYKLRWFHNGCVMLTHNRLRNATYEPTDARLCEAAYKNVSSAPAGRDSPTAGGGARLVVVDGGALGAGEDANGTIGAFFAATHVLDLPVRELPPGALEFARRRGVHIAGPVKVFQPWTTVPLNVSDDPAHGPTLSSCYHRCPTRCPDTYAPVCGVPGIVAREPSLMFQNHCFMDVAQCKMRWEEKSPTAVSSSYIESSFMFCLGDQLNAMYRFLPLVRTLQHMGRLKKKGRFRHKLRNMRFLNSLSRDPKLMG